MKYALTIGLCLLLLPMAARATLYEFTLTSLTVHPDLPDELMPNPAEWGFPSFGPGDSVLRLDLPDHRSTHSGSGCTDGDEVYREFPVPGSCESGTLENVSHWLDYDLTPDGEGGLTGWIEAHTFWHESFWIASTAPGLWAGTYLSDFGLMCYTHPCSVEGVWRRVSTPAAVPEPGTLVLILVGLGGLLMVRRAVAG